MMRWNYGVASALTAVSLMLVAGSGFAQGVDLPDPARFKKLVEEGKLSASKFDADTTQYHEISTNNLVGTVVMHEDGSSLTIEHLNVTDYRSAKRDKEGRVTESELDTSTSEDAKTVRVNEYVYYDPATSLSISKKKTTSTTYSDGTRDYDVETYSDGKTLTDSDRSRFSEFNDLLSIHHEIWRSREKDGAAAHITVEEKDGKATIVIEKDGAKIEATWDPDETGPDGKKGTWATKSGDKDLIKNPPRPYMTVTQAELDKKRKDKKEKEEAEKKKKAEMEKNRPTQPSPTPPPAASRPGPDGPVAPQIDLAERPVAPRTMSIACTSGGQMCTPAVTTGLLVTQPSSIEITFLATGNHCASIRLHVSLAGRRVTRDLLPGQSTGKLVLQPGVGEQALSVQAESIQGGCDYPFPSWDGTLAVVGPVPIMP
jgi:hypothetical protein